MPVPLLSSDLLLQHPELLNFFKEKDPVRLSYMSPTIKKEYRLVRGEDGAIIFMSTINLAIVFGKYEALKHLKLKDSYLVNVFHTVLWSLEGNYEAEVIPECSLNIIKYLVSNEEVKIAFQKELMRLLFLSSTYKDPENYIKNLLQNLAKSYDMFTEIVYKSNSYNILGWKYFINILKHSPAKLQIINFLHVRGVINISELDFCQFLLVDDGSAAEVLTHYLPPKSNFTLDYTKIAKLGPFPDEIQMRFRSLLLNSTSLALFVPVVLIFTSEQVSKIHGDLEVSRLRLSDRIRVIIDDYELVEDNLYNHLPEGDKVEPKRQPYTANSFFSESETLHTPTYKTSLESSQDENKKCAVM